MSRTVIGYLRVSTEEQDIEKNKAAILSFANEKRLGPIDWIEEKISGTVHWKQRALGQTLAGMKAGDVIIVSEISRLARSMGQIIEIIEYCKQHDIAVYAVKGAWELNGNIESKIMLYLLSMFAEIERDLISLRTKEALAARKQAGVRLGRPQGSGHSRLDEHRTEVLSLLKNGSRKNFIAKKFNVSDGTLYNWLQRNEVAM
jgi:DNA invertase Pin-like site-specific DNA recombinase